MLKEEDISMMLCIVAENVKIYLVPRFGSIKENHTELLNGLK
jgi:hypothetical protein